MLLDRPKPQLVLTSMPWKLLLVALSAVVCAHAFRGVTVQASLGRAPSLVAQRLPWTRAMQGVHAESAGMSAGTLREQPVTASHTSKKLWQLARTGGAMLLGSAALARKVRASGAVAGGSIVAGASGTPFRPEQSALLWLCLSTISAVLHAAESAMTKISPWKVQQFAEEEGPGSPFATLSVNLTRLLSTILLVTTACSIYSTALFVSTVMSVFPALPLSAVTALLTAITLFFGELLPKALAVSNSEMVARRTVPLLSRVAVLLRPATAAFTTASDFVLAFCGLRSTEDTSVSEDMLRRAINEAVKSKEDGIEGLEGRM